MADGAIIDFSEVDALAAELGRVPETAGPFINSAVQFTARNVKQQAAQSVGGSASWGAAAQAIDYDQDVFVGITKTVLSVDIGYNKAKTAGPLGNLREFGAPGSDNDIGPHNDLLNALEANQDDFENGLAKATADAEKAAGL
jgi:hypothetical protein